MSGFKQAFKKGAERAGLRTYRQVLVRGVSYGAVLAFLIWAPVRFWARLLIGVAFLLLYGMLASSTRLGRWM